jgi:hypothetical protein
MNFDLLIHSSAATPQHYNDHALPEGSQQIHVNASQLFFDLIHQNKSNIYLNFILFKHDDSLGSPIVEVITEQMLKENIGDYLFGNVNMIKYDKIPKSFHHRYLFSDFGWVNLTPEEGKTDLFAVCIFLCFIGLFFFVF